MANAAERPQGGRSQVLWSRSATGIGRRMAAGAVVLGGLALAAAAFLLIATRRLSDHFLTSDPRRRPPLLKRPEDFGLACEAVEAVAEDGLALKGWYLPGRNGATVMVQHGSPGGRQDGLVEAAFFNRHGYNVLLGSFRAHDDCEGDEISFGHHEMKDFKAWHHYILGRREVDARRIGVFGQSLGGSVAIRYAARNPDIAVLASASAPAVMAEALAHIVATRAPLPAWGVSALTRLTLFWGERRFGGSAWQLDCLPYAGQLSPRPLLIIHGGRDRRVPSEHGRMLYEAAGEPKEFWFVPEAAHLDFDLHRPLEYERRVLAFFDKYLLKEEL
jgi:fermentation-respiration switch protein FrsA (DUF1100 family)